MKAISKWDKLVRWLDSNKFWFAIVFVLVYFYGLSTSYRDMVIAENNELITQLNKDVEVYKYQMIKLRRDSSLSEIKLNACQEGRAFK